MVRKPPSTIEILTVKEAAKAVKQTTDTIYREIRAGRLKAKRPRGYTRGYFITRDDLVDWIDNGLEYVVPGEPR